MAIDYHFDEYTLRADMVQALQDYVDLGIHPGGFLTAALMNNFKETVARADDMNKRNLPALAGYIHWEIPANCHGSEEIFFNWLQKFQDDKDEHINHSV